MEIFIWQYIYIHNNKTRYIINEYGVVVNSETEKILAQTTDKYGYKIVSLNYNTKNYKCKVHRLVAKAFISNPNNKATVNHINGDKTDNYYKRLEWATQSEQELHAFKTKLKTALKGNNNGASKYTEFQVRQACQLILEHKFSDYKIEKECGLTRGYIYILRKKLAWKHIIDEYFIE